MSSAPEATRMAALYQRNGGEPKARSHNPENSG